MVRWKSIYVHTRLLDPLCFYRYMLMGRESEMRKNGLLLKRRVIYSVLMLLNLFRCRVDSMNVHSWAFQYHHKLPSQRKIYCICWALFWNKLETKFTRWLIAEWGNVNVSHPSKIVANRAITKALLISRGRWIFSLTWFAMTEKRLIWISRVTLLWQRHY